MVEGASRSCSGRRPSGWSSPHLVAVARPWSPSYVLGWRLRALHAGGRNSRAARACGGGERLRELLDDDGPSRGAPPAPTVRKQRNKPTGSGQWSDTRPGRGGPGGRARRPRAGPPGRTTPNGSGLIATTRSPSDRDVVISTVLDARVQGAVRRDDGLGPVGLIGQHRTPTPAPLRFRTTRPRPVQRRPPRSRPRSGRIPGPHARRAGLAPLPPLLRSAVPHRLRIPPHTTPHATPVEPSAGTGCRCGSGARGLDTGPVSAAASEDDIRSWVGRRGSLHNTVVHDQDTHTTAGAAANQGPRDVLPA
jgi:hypothetical protein